MRIGRSVSAGLEQARRASCAASTLHYVSGDGMTPLRNSAR